APVAVLQQVVREGALGGMAQARDEAHARELARDAGRGDGAAGQVDRRDLSARARRAGAREERRVRLGADDRGALVAPALVREVVRLLDRRDEDLGVRAEVVVERGGAGPRGADHEEVGQGHGVAAIPPERDRRGAARKRYISAAWPSRRPRSTW